MTEYEYLIIGGGMTADAAVKGIRQLDKAKKIGIISSEGHLPYNRPLLSKGLWKGDAPDKVWTKTSFENVDFYLSREARSVDPKKKIVVDDKGDRYAFDKLLFATGGSVRRLPYEVEGILYFRALDDYNHLRSLTEHGHRFAVIGGGFIGSEIAAALTMNGKSVVMIFPEDGIGARVYPPALSQFLNTFYRSKGVEILAKNSVASIVKHNQQYNVTTTDGKVFEVDGVVAGLGILPNTELARSAGVDVENGIIVNEYLQTSLAGIYAAGDVANFYSPALDKRIRVEHEDNAVTMGEVAGRNMAGEAIYYHHLPFFYSDLFELGYEAVGELDSRLETAIDWKEEFKEGVLYYMHEGRVRGILLWNTWGQVDAARSLISRRAPFEPHAVRGLLPTQIVG